MRMNIRGFAGAFALAAAMTFGLHSTAHAGDNRGQLVVSTPPKDTHVTVHNSYADVEETRTVHLDQGTNRIQLSGVASKYRPSSLRLNSVSGPGDFTFRTVAYQEANLNNKNQLAKSVGKLVTVWGRAGNGNPHPFTGTLQSVEGGVIAIAIAGRTEMVSSNDVTLVTPDGLSNTASLVLEANVSQAGDYTLNFLYETDGLSWSAQHSLVYNEDKNVVESWQTSVTVMNESGTSFKQARLHLTSTQAPTQYRGERMYAMAAAAPGGGAGSAEAAVQNLNDQKFYTIPGEINLASGESRQINLFEAKDVPVTRSYIAGRNAYYGYTSDAKQKALIELTVDNCAKNNLGKALPSGPVKIYQHSAEGNLQLTGATRIPERVENEVFDMVIGNSGDVKWQLLDQGVTPLGGQMQAHAFRVKVSNYKGDRDVVVRIEVPVPSRQSLPKPWKQTSADKAQTELKVQPKSEASVDYTIHERAPQQ